MQRGIQRISSLLLVLIFFSTATRAFSPCTNSNSSSCNNTTEFCNVTTGKCEELSRESSHSEMHLFPFTQKDLIGTIGAFFACAIAAGGGLGGGGLLVPLYMIVLGMNPHDAIPLSKATIFGNSIASLIVNAQKRHPADKARPLIDFEAMLMMEPMTLAGTIIGVNLNTIFPEWLITIMLVLLLAKTTLRTYAKGQRVYKKELANDSESCRDIVSYWKNIVKFNADPVFETVYKAAIKWKTYKRKSKSNRTNFNHEIQMTVLNSSEQLESVALEDSEQGFLFGNGVKELSDTSVAPKTLKEVRQFRNHVPWKDLLVLFGTWVALFIFSLLKGGHGAKSVIDLECGSLPYWILYATSVPFFVFVTMYFAAKTIRRHRFMANANFTYESGDMVWTRSAASKFPALCMFAGVAAGLLGIGGGMVKGPLLLEMGLLPQVSAATSASMILFTSSATTIQFIVLGSLPLDYAMWFGGVGFFAGLAGQFGLAYVVKKYHKTAIVIFSIAIVIGLSATVMGLAGIYDMFYNGLGEFRSICGAKL